MRKRALVGLMIFTFVLLSVLVLTTSIGRESPSLLDFNPEKRNPEFQNIHVEVINAAGAPQLARKVTFLMRNKGFDVVYFGNSKERLDHTIIVERVDSSLSYARILGGVIGCSNVIFDYDPDRLLEVSLILGKDYSKFFPGIDTLVILF